ncbi:MAG: ROK family protein [Phycisphaerales bacterium]
MSASVGIDIGGSSVKAVLVRPGRPDTLAQSQPYTRPDARTLRACVADAVAKLDPFEHDDARLGLSVPGLLDDAGRVTLAVNVPGLVGLDLASMARDHLPKAEVTVVADATAHACGYWTRTRAAGRMLALVMGSGVGAAVLDDGRPVTIEGASPGHIGQVDVGACGLDETPIGPDGGRGSLEAFVSARALHERFGDDIKRGLRDAPPHDPALRALARAIRICHAIYRPHRVALLGGVGICFAERLDALRGLVAADLTSIARSGWSLESGSDIHDGARGAAHLARKTDHIPNTKPI